MPAPPHQTLRKVLLASAVAVAVFVLGFYLVARSRQRLAPAAMQSKLGAGVQQSSQGFSFARSEGGRTIFQVHAGKAVQYRADGHAQLRDVNIILYGKDGTRFDQISGDDFDYDPGSGDVVARGEVQIDLEGNAAGALRPDQAPPSELKNPIHVRTRGLTFNQKTGIAATKEKIEIRVPQAAGTAVGARLDSKAGMLTLDSQISFVTSGDRTVIRARHGVLQKEPRQAILDETDIEHKDDTVHARHLVLDLGEDNTVQRMTGTGGVEGSSTGSSGKLAVQAPRADVQMTAHNHLRTITLSGGASWTQSGAKSGSVRGSAGRVVVDYGERNRATAVHASEDVRHTDHTASGQEYTLFADALDATASKGDGNMDHAVTRGASRIEIVSPNAKPAGSVTRTVITAGHFEGALDAASRIRTLHGEPEARIVSSAPNRPERVSSSRVLDAVFAQTKSSTSALQSVVQQGDVHITEGTRQAWADRARYSPADDALSLSGSPRVTDTGMSTTADSVVLDRKSGEAVGTGNVKTTYVEMKAQPQGALLAASDPVHVTARSMVARQASATAHYEGEARLWQGANVIQAPQLDFDRTHRTLVALGTSAQPVRLVLVQKDKQGRAQPVNVTALRLIYNDIERRALLEGGVDMKSADGSTTADRAEIFLEARGPGASSPASTASRVERAVAEGRVEMREPGRHASGDRLVYSSDEEKYVLTGSPPRIEDAQSGTVTGEVLTFYSRDDRVLVESGNSTRTVTQTRVKR